jgi:hypothetical protein
MEPSIDFATPRSHFAVLSIYFAPAWRSSNPGSAKNDRACGVIEVLVLWGSVGFHPGETALH